MRTKHWLWIGTFGMLALIFATAGCGDDDDDKDDVTGPSETASLDFPTTVGSTWTYDKISESTTFPADTIEVVTTVTDTRDIDGLLYACLVDQLPGFADTTYFREDEGALYIYPGYLLEPGPEQDPFDIWIFDLMTRSLPWKFADANAVDGQVWTIYDDSTSVEAGDPPVLLQVVTRLEFERVGTTSVTVPAGSWSDVYHGRMTNSTTSTFAGGRMETRSTQDLYLVEGVGLVRQETSSFFRPPALPPEVHSTDQTLKSFTINP